MRFLILLIPFQVWAMPENLEVWFVQKSRKVVSLDSSIEVAQNSYQCIKVGENCFDPQIGLYDPKKLEKSGEIEIPEAAFDDEWEELEKNSRNYEDLSSLDVLKRSAHKCDDTTYFDVFCGKAKRFETKKIELEVFIDGTESMGRIDSADLKKECFRSSLARRIFDSCEAANIYTFHHSRTKIHNPQQACVAQSITDDDRLIQWIKSSNAKRLVVITEKTEVGKKFVDFAYMNQADFRGEKLGEELLIQQLPGEITRLKKSCRN